MKIAIGFAALTLLIGCGQGQEAGGVTPAEQEHAEARGRGAHGRVGLPGFR